MITKAQLGFLFREKKKKAKPKASKLELDEKHGSSGTTWLRSGRYSIG